MKIIISLLLIFLADSCFSDQSNKINEDWVKEDFLFIQSLKLAFTDNPVKVITLLKSKEDRKIKLGFGYSMIEGSNGKGYVSTSYRIIYKDTMVVSYELIQQMPNEDILKEKYKKMYTGLFEFEGNKTKPKYYNYNKMIRPLNVNNISIKTSDAFKYYMTPYSGILYGNRGGYANSVIEYRKNYLSIKSQLNPDLYEYLLYSKNPATRLVAIEYFHSKAYISENIKNRIESIFTELPMIQTMSGCNIHSGKVRKLVKQYSYGSGKEN